MGQRGPAPKPSSLVLLEGNVGKRALNTAEPQPDRKRPKMPAHLDEGAKKEWRRLIPILERMRVLTEADGIALATLCQTYSTLIDAQLKLSATGVLYTSKLTGVIHQSPLLTVVTTCTDQITRLLREFGLTPASRSRLVTDDSGKRQNGGLLNGQWRAKA